MKTDKHSRPIRALVLGVFVAAIAPAAAVTLEDNIVAWWLLGENATLTGGDTITEVPEHTGNSVAAESRGSPQRVAGNPFDPFPFGDSYATRTSDNNYLLVPDDSSYNFADEDFSVSLWARADNGGGQWQKLFQRNVGGDVFWQSETDGEGRTTWNIRSGGNAEIRSTNIFKNDTDWHHLVYLRDTVNGELRAYIDGVESTDPTGGTHGTEPEVGSPAGTGALGIGAENNGVKPFPGDIDDFRIYNVALTDEQVLEIYNAGRGDFAPSAKFQLDVNHLPVTDEIEVKWPSQTGKLYNLRSETDPASAEPINWPIYGGHQDIVATPPENTLTFPRPGDPLRLLVIEEFDAPPQSIWSENFDAVAALPAGWTTGANTPPDAGTTTWEVGTPVRVGPSAANSPANCACTNLGSGYGINTAIWLRSSPIDLTTVGEATLHYSRFVDIEESFDEGVIRVLDASDDSVLGVLQQGIDNENGQPSTDWEDSSASFPPEAIGKSVKLEFFLDCDDFDDGAFAGFYIDDLNVTVP